MLRSMQEKEMEFAVANCPELFIEPGLTLIRRQPVIHGRRPDILFSDSLSRHVLVELQKGRLDENHLQRHFYYFYDYRGKYPETHPRLVFIANRIVPQHKEFLDDHGYEFREYPEGDFERKAAQCVPHLGANQIPLELAETPGVLPERFHDIVYEIDAQEMTLCYKMLLLTYMAELANEDGRVPLGVLAERFKAFFVQRSVEGKFEENPNRVASGVLSGRSISEWKRTVREQPVHYLTEKFVIDEGEQIRWAPRLWSQWSPIFREQIRIASWDRLVRYFNRHVPGGY
jgi:hypothetical protein